MLGIRAFSSFYWYFGGFFPTECFEALCKLLLNVDSLTYMSILRLRFYDFFSYFSNIVLPHPQSVSFSPPKYQDDHHLPIYSFQTPAVTLDPSLYLISLYIVHYCLESTLYDSTANPNVRYTIFTCLFLLQNFIVVKYT